MANHFVQLPAPRMPANAMIDTAPLTDALDKYRTAQQDNAMLALRQSRDQREAETHGWDRQKNAFAAEDRRNKTIGSAAQALLDMPPEKRPQALAAIRSLDPSFDSGLRSAGFDPDDVDTWGPVAIARARGVQDPDAVAKTRADIDYTRARADYYRGGGAGKGRLSADERIAERYMEEDEDLSWSEALAKARRRPSDDTQRESLASRNARYGLDPAEVEPWRERYGLGKPSNAAQGPGQQPGGANRFDFSGRMRGNVDQQGLLNEAREAIRRGANPESVRQRLRDQYGIDGSGL